MGEAQAERPVLLFLRRGRMHRFLHQLLQALREAEEGRFQGLATSAPHRRLLLAVSGGADSVALLRGLHALRPRLGGELRVAHLNHRLRGEEAAADAAWVERLCEELGLQVTLGVVDVADESRRRGSGIEETARQLRYDFLRQTARANGCGVIVTAHTADDLAETVLHHLLRGTGLAGLAGIPTWRPLTDDVWLWRPLLGISRQEIEDYLAQLRQDYRHDETNRDLVYTRNRLRHELLSWLEREYNPQLKSALGRLAQQAAEVQETLALLAGALLDRTLIVATPESCELLCAKLSPSPRHLLREVFVELFRRQQWPRQQFTHEHWDGLAHLVLAGGSLTLPGGITACRRQQVLRLEVATR